MSEQAKVTVGASTQRAEGDDVSKQDAAYCDWKAWDAASFGTYTPWHRAYYRSEVKRAGIPTVRTSLEIGFGHGSFLAFARDNGIEVSGIEVNGNLREMARRAGFEAYSDMVELPKGRRFDLVVALNVMEHIPQDVIPSFLSSIMERLNPDGAFIATFPNGDSPFCMLHQNGDVTHTTTLGSQKVQYLVQLAGFNLVRCGAPSLPIIGAGLKKGAYAVVARPLRRVFSVFFGLLFLQRTDIPFDPDLSIVVKNK